MFQQRKDLSQSQEMLLHKSDSSDTMNSLENKEQRSPESVLCESQQLQLSYEDNFSSEMILELQQNKLDLELIEVKQIDELSKENIDTPTDKCFPMDKTLSFNDEMKLCINNCKSIQNISSFSKTRLDVCTYDTDIHSPTSVYNLPCGYVSEPAQFTTFNSDMEPKNHNFLKKFQTVTSICEPVGQFKDENKNKYYENWNTEDQNTRFKIINEKTLQETNDSCFTVNWNDCRQILSNLQQLNGKMQANIQECSENSNEYTNKRSYAEVDEAVNKVDNRQEYKEIGKNETRIRSGSTTPCSGSPPPAKRCKTTLKFDNIEEIGQSQKPVISIPVTNLLLAEKKNVQNFFCLDTTISKTAWSSCTTESPTTSTLDLPVVSDSGSCSRNLQDPEQGAEFNKKCTCSSSQQNRKSSRFQFFKKPIAKIILFCVWLTKKLSNTFKNDYRSFKQTVSVSSSKEHTQRLEKLCQVVIMLRTENEQMINTILDKVKHLSEEITQVRTRNVTAIAALTTEVGSLQKISRKLAEKNETLMQELKKLHKMLEDTRTRSPKPLPPPPPPMPSILKPSSLTYIPPPPPPPPPTFFQSSVQPITPTTPKNSGRNIRTPTRKCSTPFLHKPAITVEDLLKVTLKKAPQNVKENRRNTISGPRGPVVSLDMLRSVKLKSVRRRTTDKIMRSPRSARMIKSRTAQSLSLSPILTGADNSLERILKQVDVNRRGPRRLLSSSSNFHETSIAKDNHLQNAHARDSSSRSVI